MQDMFGSVRRSLVFRSPDNGDEGVGGRIVDKIGSYIRRSMVMSRSLIKDSTPQIRWRKGELIGCGAFGRVYMGMNLDSGELLAVKQVLIASNHVSKEKAQDHVRELEEEVKLLKNLSHPNIVRYLGTVREDDTLNILLEFVPGGSISSLLGKFGSFPEAVIRMYTKQILLGLEYLHKNNIIHRDIKGANILVDNKGCIKLADFGASKKVVQLATMTGAKSMKGTPYWMAPEVIRQTGHTFSADIWSVGCTVIEMATGKPPWSQQFQEVAALFHIGTTMSHPPIPEHLSPEAKDFLLQCLQKEADLRPSASVLLKHPFVTGECQETAVLSSSASENSPYPILKTGSNLKNSPRTTHSGSKDVCHISKVSCSTMYLDKSSKTLPVWETNTSDDEMCQIYDKDDFPLSGSVKSNPCLVSSGFKSFNPMDEPLDDGQSNFESPEPERKGIGSDASHQIDGTVGSCGTSGDGFNFHNHSVSEDDDEVTETKIRAFLDEKALDLKKLQTEFYNTLNGSSPSAAVRNVHGESSTSYLNLPPKSRSPSRAASETPTIPVNAANKTSPGNCSRRESNVGGIDYKNMQDAPMQPVSEWKGLLVSQEQPINPSFEEKSRKWKEELDQELERKRELMRQAGVGGKTSSPKDRANFPRDRSRFASPGR